MLFAAKEKVLFTGDSITDCGRRDHQTPLGNGFAFLVSSMVDAMHAELELTWENRGIGGENIIGMGKRWQKDCIGLDCDWVSILIGINDAHGYKSGCEELSPENYIENYRALLDKTSGQLILWEPFYFAPKVANSVAVADVIGEYISAVNTLADEFSDRVAVVIHTQELFAKAVGSRGTDFWLPDGVHPTPAGHALMALEFLKTIGWRE